MNGTTDKKSFQLKTRCVCFTVFGKEVEDDPEAVLRQIAAHCNWAIGQQECCPDSKRLHLQAMAWSKEPARWGYLPKGCHREACKDPIKSIAYVTKEESRVSGPWEFGDRPTFNVKGEKLKQQAEKNKLLIEKDVVTLVNEGHISFTSVPSIIKAKNYWTMINPGEAKLKEPNEWIYGEPGCGKTRFVKDNYDNFYEKSQNKWWDAYKGEDVVLIDDFDKQGRCLGHLLKIWGDRYFGWKGETKGGTIQPNFKKLIITSNYSPEQIWGGTGPDADLELVAAIERRFRLGYMDKDTHQIEWALGTGFQDLLNNQ